MARLGQYVPPAHTSSNRSIKKLFLSKWGMILQSELFLDPLYSFDASGYRPQFSGFNEIAGQCSMPSYSSHSCSTNAQQKVYKISQFLSRVLAEYSMWLVADINYSLNQLLHYGTTDWSVVQYVIPQEPLHRWIITCPSYYWLKIKKEEANICGGQNWSHIPCGILYWLC